MDKYQDYIAARERNYLMRGVKMKGHCQQEAELMAAWFPDLRVARGYFVGSRDRHPDMYQHWWCVLERKGFDSEIFDPTASQFDFPGYYEEYDEAKHGPMPVGKCRECGELVYQNEEGHTDFCNSTCSQSYVQACFKPYWSA